MYVVRMYFYRITFSVTDSTIFKWWIPSIGFELIISVPEPLFFLDIVFETAKKQIIKSKSNKKIKCNFFHIVCKFQNNHTVINILKATMKKPSPNKKSTWLLWNLQWYIKKNRYFILVIFRFYDSFLLYLKNISKVFER